MIVDDFIHIKTIDWGTVRFYNPYSHAKSFQLECKYLVKKFREMQKPIDYKELLAKYQDTEKYTQRN